MIFYKLTVEYKYCIKRTEEFPKGAKFKNFKNFFEDDKKIFRILGYDKKNNHIYSEWEDGDYYKYIYNNESIWVYVIDNFNNMSYPAGKDKYDEYMQEK